MAGRVACGAHHHFLLHVSYVELDGGAAHERFIEDVSVRTIEDVSVRIIEDASVRITGNAHERFIEAASVRIVEDACERIIKDAHERFSDGASVRITDDAERALEVPHTIPESCPSPSSMP